MIHAYRAAIVSPSTHYHTGPFPWIDLMERNLTTSAIVLRSRRWGDLHRRITIISAELGIVDVLAYGARKGKLSGRIDQFLHGRFYLYHNPVRGDYSVIDVEPIVSGDRIRNDLKRTYAASVMAELILKMNGGDYVSLFALLASAFALLDREDGAAVDRIVIQFIWKLVEISGIAPNLLNCPVCDKRYLDDEVLFFNTAIHAPCCRLCSDVDAQSGEMALGPGARKYLVFTNGLPISDAVRVPLSDAANERIKLYMLRYASIAAGGGLKTLSGGLL